MLHLSDAIGAVAELFGLEKIGDIFRWPDGASSILGVSACSKRPFLHDRDAIRHGHPVGQVMRHINRCQAMFLVELQDFAAHFQPIGRIDVAQRFVHQHDAAAPCHGPAEGDALLLAAGKLARLALEKTFFNADSPGQWAEKLGDFVARTIFALSAAAIGCE